MDDIQNFLTSSDLAHLIPAFLEQNIDSVTLLPYLSDSHIDKLITTFGDQIRFRKAVNDLKATGKPTTESSTSSNEVVKSFEKPCSTIVCLEENSAKRAKLEETPLATLNVNDTRFLYVVEENSDVVHQTIPRTSTASFSTVTDLSQSDCGLNSSLISIYPNNVSDFDLNTLIQGDAIGRAVYVKYKRTNTLANKDRSDISEIIISHFLNLSYKLNNDSLSNLAEKIVDLFPTELKTTYFVSPISKKKSRHNKPEVAKGRLVDKHRNKLTALRRLQNGTVESSETEEELKEPTQAAKDAKIWLACNNVPINDVIENWKLTADLRKRNNNTSSTIENLYQEWPILQNQIAVQLIDIDFQQLFKIPPIENLAKSFDDFFEKVLNRRRSKLSAADETFLNLLGGNITSDSKVAIKLYLLSSLIPPRGRTRIPSGNKQWKPTTNECRDGYLQHVKTLEEVAECKERKVDDMFKKGTTVQPYILLVGSHLANVCAAYVVINDHTYKVESVLEALDFTFKVYHVLVAKYPFECQHIWSLIQLALYKLKTKYDVTIPYIQDLL